MTTAVRPAATVVVLRPRGPSDDAPELYMLRRSSKSAFMPDALVFPGGRVEHQDGADEDQSFAQAARRECIEEASLAVEVERLRWFDTWKTPSGESPRRFLARFYLTTIAPEQGHDAVADGVETRAGRWASAATILDQWRAEQVDLPPPTLSILLGIAAGEWREWLERAPEGAREPILPKLAPVDSSIHIVMPHDPEYASLPGDTGPVPARVKAFPRRFVRTGKRWVPLLLGAALMISGGCKDVPSEAEPAKAGAATSSSPASAEPASAAPASAAPASASELELLLAWMPPDPLAVAYDRVHERLDPAILSVVFAIPPKAADLLDERATLDEGLDVVFDGEAEARNWLSPTTLAFSVALSKSPYFVRPLSKPVAEVAPLFEQAGFSKNTVEGFDVWLPDGSFPWRVAVLDEVAVFIPVDVPGAGLEPLSSARDQDASAVEQELARALNEDPSIQLVLFSAGPLVHFDVGQTIAQVQFALRQVPGPGAKPGYEGQIRLTPSGDVDECANGLRARTHPEENQQVQKLIAAVEFLVEDGGVIGRLAIAPEQVKHFVDR